MVNHYIILINVWCGSPWYNMLRPKTDWNTFEVASSKTVLLFKISLSGLCINVLY